MFFDSGYCHKHFHTQPREINDIYSFSADEGGLFTAKTHLNKMKMGKNIFSGGRFLFRLLTLPVRKTWLFCETRTASLTKHLLRLQFSSLTV